MLDRRARGAVPFRGRGHASAAARSIADFTGTSPQQPRAINCVLAYTYAMTAYAIKAALLPDLPNNEGMFRPITVTAPEGCLLNPRMPGLDRRARLDRPLRAAARSYGALAR